MRESARFQSTFEVIATYDYTKGPLDHFLQNFLKARRYMGSSDRRFVSDHVYDYFKKLPALKRLVDSLSFSTVYEFFLSYLVLFVKSEPADIQNLLNGEPYGLPAFTPRDHEIITALAGVSTTGLRPRDYFPGWILEEAAFQDPDAECEALLQQAPLDVRLNAQGLTRSQALYQLASLGIQAELCALSPLGLRLSPRQKIQSLALFKEGLLEVQDEGSQLIGILCDVKPGMVVLDYCAGAGGKTLLLNYLMKGEGRLVASDIQASRLEILQRRQTGKAVKNIDIIPQDRLDPAERYDRVLCDAPCSGTGTFRRRPEFKNFLTPADVQKDRRIQQDILTQAQGLVKPGGQLIYATCSLLQTENEDQAAWFLKNFPSFKQVHLGQRWASMGLKKTDMPGPYYKTTPAQHQTDGFFAAVFEKSQTL